MPRMPQMPQMHVRRSQAVQGRVQEGVTWHYSQGTKRALHGTRARERALHGTRARHMTLERVGVGQTQPQEGERDERESNGPRLHYRLLTLCPGAY